MITIENYNIIKLVFEWVQWCRYVATAVDEIFAREFIYLHNWSIAEKSTEGNLVACFFAVCWYYTDSRSFLIYDSYHHFVSDDSRNCLCTCIARNSNHIKTYRANTSHSFKFFYSECLFGNGIYHTLVFWHRNKCTA